MGSKKSSTATNTTSSYYDQREVNDNSGNSGIVGSGNSFNTSLTTNTSTSNTNSGNTTLNVLDGGAIKGMTDVALAQSDLSASIAESLRKASDNTTAAAIKAQENALSTVDKSTSKAFDWAAEQSKAAFKSSADALGLANKAADGLAAAYSAAAEQQNGNKTLTIAAVAAVGVVVALAVFSKK